jgi:hypothetical protein
MDIQTTASMVLLIAGILYVTAMFVYRKITEGQVFDLQRYATTLGYVAMVAVGAYIVTGVVPDFNAVLGEVEQGIPEGAALLTVVTSFIFGLINFFLKKAKTSPTATAVAAAKPTAGVPVSTSAVSVAPVDEIKSFGFTVLPTYLEGKSPYLAAFKVVCSQSVESVVIDFLDGTVPSLFKLIAEGEYMVANINHQYIYVAEGKYTGHTFYPKITVNGKNGRTQEFNTETTGRCLSILVSA